MSVTTVGSNDSQSIGSLVLQQLLAGSSSSTDSSGLTGIMGDLLSLSSTSQQLAKAPAAITSAMNDLFSTQQDVSGDLTKLKAYFDQNPTSLSGLLGSLQGSSSTYSASGTLGANSALLAAMAKAQAGGTDTTALLTSLLGGQSSDPLLASLGASSSSSGSLSFLG